MSKENNRIEKYYKERKKMKVSSTYTYYDLNNLYMIQSRERKLLKLLAKYGVSDLSNSSILDVGCGTGGMLRNFVQYGAQPRNLYGVDLIGERIKKAKEISSNIHFTEGDATKLPYQSNHFDVLCQYTVFTSIIEKEVKEEVAREMVRVLNNNGIIIWYDMRITNPFDKNKKSIGKREIRALFPECECSFYSVTLNPVISRMLSKISIVLCQIVENLKLLNSHYLVVIRKK
ncbi:MAG: hypothetical protein A2044_02685 [Candidatus Firestonebacteria bacterium GWA2_43_8]|nr:MAG: hypothetical protein A2044_02685 [Candidatus Firestonebacteria bacterium GWA2_43_8]